MDKIRFSHLTNSANTTANFKITINTINAWSDCNDFEKNFDNGDEVVQVPGSYSEGITPAFHTTTPTTLFREAELLSE